MTLAAVFIRKVPNRQNRDELVVVADTTLTGGQRFDQGAKIFQLPRNDALFCFAGLTYYAYPLAMQLASAVGSYDRSIDLRHPLRRVVQHASRIFALSFELIHHTPSDGLPVDMPASFLFGGFSWHDNDFKIWKIAMDREGRRFPLEEVNRSYAFIGTAEALPEAEERLAELLRDRGKTDHDLDMEPFEVVRDIIREGKYSDIGGVPQIAKVFRYMKTHFYATLWRCEDGRTRPHAFGRPLYGWENTSWSMFDPDTLHFNAARPDDPA
ncbi:hypothetical protein [Burkholderia pseudomultivorans]|uniref:hypothetical protein n=1 Tax=Burkholderia pseudomultivorans TaxID=1207504 RepID=UPI000752B404|nr:hypothetical protein [Burkholderia pseudomultivorans]KVC24497.1 hypothetical protein WS56_29715 [Burkholderia pseudomultivorans]KVC24884.1 hypothetical protein WS55_17555 [Burkholderia pseudomultivorans]